MKELSKLEVQEPHKKTAVKTADKTSNRKLQRHKPVFALASTAKDHARADTGQYLNS